MTVLEEVWEGRVRIEATRRLCSAGGERKWFMECECRMDCAMRSYAMRRGYVQKFTLPSIPESWHIPSTLSTVLTLHSIYIYISVTHLQLGKSAQMNISATVNIFRLFRDPSLCLPQHTVSTFNQLPIPLSSAFSGKDGEKGPDIRAVVLDKDNCFAVPKENRIYEPYNVSAIFRISSAIIRVF